MTRQTNIGLLLALIFIVAFSLVLTEFRQPEQNNIDRQDMASVDDGYYKQPTQELVSPVRPAVRSVVRRAVRPENRRTIAAAVAPAPIQRAATAEVAVARTHAAEPASQSRTAAPAQTAPAHRTEFVAGTIHMPQNNASANYREKTIDEFAQDVAQLPDRKNQPTRRVYTVIRGDNLRKISKKIYNSDSKWRKIYDANRSKLKNPNDIQIGMTLVIPEV
ncbi:MAG TPA: LysM peptidoglycan-binding domain-containing protein [Phycisphaerae bacterium]|nr:LysM peptidoglycan-binding domain-containing protein [Phycisphaerae bacterium]HPS53366.1 LysM peptidoglycan-binding domain-containing protein [Phycisphaerae bacterium]